MWAERRDRRLGGFKFVRQSSIGSYFADFACRSEKVVVEIDGGTHGNALEVERDAVRTAFLERDGYRVFRTHNDEVFHNLGGVLETLLAVLRGDVEVTDGTSSSPSSGLRPPSPRKDGEKEERTI